MDLVWVIHWCGSVSDPKGVTERGCIADKKSFPPQYATVTRSIFIFSDRDTRAQDPITGKQILPNLHKVILPGNSQIIREICGKITKIAPRFRKERRKAATPHILLDLRKMHKKICGEKKN